MTKLVWVFTTWSNIAKAHLYKMEVSINSSCQLQWTCPDLISYSVHLYLALFFCWHRRIKSSVTKLPPDCHLIHKKGWSVCSLFSVKIRLLCITGKGSIINWIRTRLNSGVLPRLGTLEELLRTIAQVKESVNRTNMCTT